MNFGIVSNCWRTQLESGETLDALIAEAARLGYGHIELRQGCLGAYEAARDGDTFPEPEALLQLHQRFPGTPFNLALALPFLSGTVSPQSPLFQTGLRAAVSLSGAGSRHLRLVDPETPAEALTAVREVEAAQRLAELAAECARADAWLSVENARQAWSSLRHVLDRARARLGDQAGALGLCYDPCNLLSAADHPDPQTATSQLRAEEIALFHYKQNRDGTPHPEVGPGEIDWAAQLAALKRIGYTGACLFEIPPGSDIWERLDRSRRYLEGL
jgi:sugar phosphate isomerase/epimerase